MILGIVLTTSISLGARVAAAQEHAAAAEPASGQVEHASEIAHPTLSSDGSWAGVMVIVVLGMFLAAAAVGVVVRANMPEELPPPAHSHDEPPGASHHHGAGGTIDTHEPEHDSHSRH
jgi:hypothetical protein